MGLLPDLVVHFMCFVECLAYLFVHINQALGFLGAILGHCLAEFIHKRDILLCDVGIPYLLSELLFLGKHGLEAMAPVIIGIPIVVGIAGLFACFFDLSLLRVKVFSFGSLVDLDILLGGSRVLIIFSLLLLHCQLCELVLAVYYLVDRIWI